MCTDIPYEPFEFEKDGKPVGFDIDLVDEVAKELELKAAHRQRGLRRHPVRRAAQRRHVRCRDRGA